MHCWCEQWRFCQLTSLTRLGDHSLVRDLGQDVRVIPSQLPALHRAVLEKEIDLVSYVMQKITPRNKVCLGDYASLNLHAAYGQ
jgi:hypothetical protein